MPQNVKIIHDANRLVKDESVDSSSGSDESMYRSFVPDYKKSDARKSIGRQMNINNVAAAAAEKTTTCGYEVAILILLIIMLSDNSLCDQFLFY